MDIGFHYKFMKIKILNVLIDNIDIEQVLALLKEGVVVTPNVDHLMILQKDEYFYRIYKNTDYILCDSKIVQIASFFLKTPIKYKISGSDFFPEFCRYHKRNSGIKIFLLGSADGVAKKAARRINAWIGRPIIVGSISPSFGFEKNDKECSDILHEINISGASVLAIGVGAPKQEKWIAKYKQKMPNIKIFLAIGATIDFQAGVIKRSPSWISNIGFEWLYRLFCDPKRLWKRYLINDFPFFFLILKQKLGLYKNPWK